MSILPLPTNLPGNESAADKAIALKVNELVTAANAGESKDTAHAGSLAALETRVASLTTRIAALEQADEPDPSPVPVASVGVAVSPSAVKIGESAQATVTLKDMAGNVLAGRPYTLATSAPTIATVAGSGVVNALAAGTATITATAEGKSGSASLAVTAPVVVDPVPDPIVIPPPEGSIATVAELPRLTPVALVKGTAGTVRRVATAAELQPALNAARPGDTVLLAPGLVCVGEYILPASPWTDADPPITLRTDVVAGTGRMTPTKAATLKLAKLVAPSVAPALRTTNLDQPTRGWIIQDLEITGTAPQTVIQYGLLALGDGGWAAGGDSQTTLARVPRRFLVERVYLHGSPTLNCVRGIALNSGETVIRSSWISEIHAIGSDSQACCGWNGPGPYLVEDCTLEAAGENIMFGGADPGIAGLVPSDITFRRCHFPKPLSWKGSQWSVKNLFELKSARRVLVEHCVLENCWPASQEGMAIVIKSANAGCINCTYVGTQDVTFRWNIVRNAAVGLNLQAADNSYGHTNFVHVQRITVTDNLFDRIGAEGRAALILATGDLSDITLHRNTFLHDPGVGTSRGGAMIMDYGNAAARRLDIRSNLMTAGAYLVFYTGGALGAAALTQMAGTSFVFTGNAMPYGGPYASKFPAGNTFPSSVPAVDLSKITAATAGVVVAP